MKKFLAIATLAVVMVACGDAKQTADETKPAEDSLSNAATEVAAAADSTIKTGADTAMPTIDTTKK